MITVGPPESMALIAVSWGALPPPPTTYSHSIDLRLGHCGFLNLFSHFVGCHLPILCLS
jgi:hypothetical protein